MSLQLKHGTSSLMQPLRSIPSTREPILMVSLQIFQRRLIDTGVSAYRLAEADVVEPHLPHVAAKTPTSTPSGTASAPRSPNGQPRVVASVIAPFMALLLAMYLPF
ncbi:hypothetical protein V6N13_121575 [Hibiscus sabdariffa]